MRQKPIHDRLRRLSALCATIPEGIYRLGRRRLGFSSSPELYYIVPDVNWVTDWVGYYITTGVTQQFGWRAHLTALPYFLVDHLIHYGELGAFLGSLRSRCNGRNTIITTVFHGSRSNQFPELACAVDRLLENIHIPQKILTTNRIMETRLVEWGVPIEKVVCIPLGIDLTHFKPPLPQQRLECRRKMGIPDDALCIGSFQKDGTGWGDGLIPKLIKGPDTFLHVIERLREQYKLFVLLSGPARGYVKQGLDALGVPYRHEVLPHYWDIVSLYHCLDVYLVSSREEGGPKAVLESMATGVPLTSTNIGMAHDLIQHGENGLLAESDDIDMLAQNVTKLIDEPDLRHQLVANGLTCVSSYDWPRISARYYRELYLPILREQV